MSGVEDTSISYYERIKKIWELDFESWKSDIYYPSGVKYVSFFSFFPDTLIYILKINTHIIYLCKGFMLLLGWKIIHTRK
jgi:hypothetical protein